MTTEVVSGEIMNQYEPAWLRKIIFLMLCLTVKGILDGSE
jgi:hypothetical protein